jgi:hypothetical protein
MHGKTIKIDFYSFLPKSSCLPLDGHFEIFVHTAPPIPGAIHPFVILLPYILEIYKKR